MVIIQKYGYKGKKPKQLPDGLENLAEYNLITYKSLKEPLERWTLDELVGYYTTYRKQLSPSLKTLLPLKNFQLYAVCTRQPQWVNRLKEKKQLQKWIYEVNSFTRPIRIIVTSQLSPTKGNAFWQLYSGNSKGFMFGEQYYHWNDPKNRGLIGKLDELYQQEVDMSYTFKDFRRDYAEEIIKSLPLRGKV